MEFVHMTAAAYVAGSTVSGLVTRAWAGVDLSGSLVCGTTTRTLVNGKRVPFRVCRQ